MSVGTVTQDILILSAVLLALGVIWQKGIVVVVKGIRQAVRVFDLVETHLPTLVDIAAEFKPNHGSSLRDAVDSIEATIDGMDDQLGFLSIRVGNLEQFHVNNL